MPQLSCKRGRTWGRNEIDGVEEKGVRRSKKKGKKNDRRREKKL